jgi:DNA-binding HxlR family transcriptional regulator
MTPFVSADLKLVDKEILEFLFREQKARFIELRDHLMKTLEWKNKGSLEVRLSRRLRSLEAAKYVQREKKSHKQVYYSLTRFSLKRLELEHSKLIDFIKKAYPSLTSGLRIETTTSILKSYLKITPSVLFEILTEFFKKGFPEEAEQKQINLLLSEFLIKTFESMIEELKIRFGQGEDIQRVFNDVSTWVYQKYAEEEEL